jgi:hypothetical protein
MIWISTVWLERMDDASLSFCHQLFIFMLPIICIKVYLIYENIMYSYDYCMVVWIHVYGCLLPIIYANV